VPVTAAVAVRPVARNTSSTTTARSASTDSNDPSAQTEVPEVTVQKLDEDAALYAADDLAEEDDAYVIDDARDVVEDGYEADVVKVLGGGQVRRELRVTADAFTAGAVELIEEAGGEATLSERAEEAADESENTSDDEDDEA